MSGLAPLATGALVALTAAAGPAAAATTHAPASSGCGRGQARAPAPNTPPVDVYLYSYGKPNAMIVLKHVAYGTVSPYERVPHGCISGLFDSTAWTTALPPPRAGPLRPCGHSSWNLC